MLWFARCFGAQGAPASIRQTSPIASMRVSTSTPVAATLDSLRSHGLPLQCPNGEGGENTHYWEGIAEMINHSPNATTTVCAEAFEVVPAWQTVTRYIMQLCAAVTGATA